MPRRPPKQNNYGRGFQLPFNTFVPTVSWTPPEVSSLPSWKEAKRVAVDIETRDDYLKALGPGVRRGVYIVGISFAIEDHPDDFYLPIRHGWETKTSPAPSDWNNLNLDSVLDYFSDQARNFRGELVLSGGDYELDYFEEESISFLNGPCQAADVATLDALLWEHHKKYSLDAILERRGLPMKDESLLRDAAKAYNVDPKKGLWRLPGRFAALYGKRDSRGPLQIYAQQRAELAQICSKMPADKPNMNDAWNLEKRVAKTLVRMTRRGVPVNVPYTEQLIQWTLDEEARQWGIVKELTGIRVKVGHAMKAAVLAPIFEKMGFHLNYTGGKKQDQANIDKGVLKAANTPWAKAIGRARDVSGMRSKARKRLKYLVKGRLHPTFNPVRREKGDDGGSIGTRSVRLSANHPGMHQEMGRDEVLGPMWRGIYTGEPGELNYGGDYSQQEPRMAVHYASILELTGADEIVRRYIEDPLTDFHTMTSEITGLGRKYAKGVGLGAMYEKGSGKMARDDFKLPYEEVYDERFGKTRLIAGPEAQAIYDSFMAKVPWLRELMTEAKKRGARNGEIRLMLGHVVHFQRDPSNGKFMHTHKSLNRLIQGGSAEQTKLAMVLADEAGLWINLQVHDELRGSGSYNDALKLKEIMENAVKLAVPMRVDLEVGPSWGECKEPPKHDWTAGMFWALQCMRGYKGHDESTTH